MPFDFALIRRYRNAPTFLRRAWTDVARRTVKLITQFSLNSRTDSVRLSDHLTNNNSNNNSLSFNYIKNIVVSLNNIIINNNNNSNRNIRQIWKSTFPCLSSPYTFNFNVYNSPLQRYYLQHLLRL